MFQVIPRDKDTFHKLSSDVTEYTYDTASLQQIFDHVSGNTNLLTGISGHWINWGWFGKFNVNAESALAWYCLFLVTLCSLSSSVPGSLVCWAVSVQKVHVRLAWFTETPNLLCFRFSGTLCSRIYSTSTLATQLCLLCHQRTWSIWIWCWQGSTQGRTDWTKAT